MDGPCPGTTPAVGLIAYDGFTVEFQAFANVIPGETYHIKFAISDVIDALYDSAVLISLPSVSTDSCDTPVILDYTYGEDFVEVEFETASFSNYYELCYRPIEEPAVDWNLSLIHI